ncbi:acetate/propionate family kinase [Pseudomonas sp. GCM10022188]|uniref:acetate/propionate family kinase n=1 Tax=Pseudomonas TaxID=286 RepID=UPI001E3BE729|nr:acetate/propionate family kinase [Pseudomonas oryzagri]MCC6076634.1 acetate/propionate family kinase [Pseudomonas oryzagri]
MEKVILVLNAGSSSLKFSLYADGAGDPELRLHGQIEDIRGTPHFIARDEQGTLLAEQRWNEPLEQSGAALHLVEFLRSLHKRFELVAVGHRVVHGGEEFSAPVRVDAATLDRLARFSPLAPLHQPHNLAAIRAIAERAPQLPQVACFDTAFHRRQPELAQLFALPTAITARGVRRYGFHGLSYEYIASVLPQLDPVAARGRVVVAHLGNGASLCAMDGGRSVAGTTGFTALDGLPMGTRCGSLDPGVILYLLDELQMDARAIERLLYKESGLLGVSGLSSDMRELLASDSPRAVLAVELFVYRIGREIGSLAAALGGLDALVFTAGIGEHALPIRERVCRAAAWLGVELDPAANAAGGPRISTPGSAVSVWVIPTDEELMIARHTRRTLSPT